MISSDINKKYIYSCVVLIEGQQQKYEVVLLVTKAYKTKSPISTSFAFKETINIVGESN